ncbi:MAG: hypothetical protein WDO73_13125 [Ignavibacteriota bacterium]
MGSRVECLSDQVEGVLVGPQFLTCSGTYEEGRGHNGLIMPCRSLLLLCVAGAWAQTPTPPGRMVDVGGYRVHVNCVGAGSPTVMIVGAGFSFDWALVQPEVARFATVCTYDASGTAWSDPGPELTCRERVSEIHKLTRAAPLRAP